MYSTLLRGTIPKRFMTCQELEHSHSESIYICLPSAVIVFAEQSFGWSPSDRRTQRVNQEAEVQEGAVSIPGSTTQCLLGLRSRLRVLELSQSPVGNQGVTI